MDEDIEHILFPYMDTHVWSKFKDMLDWTVIPGYGIKEVLRFLCDTYVYYNKRMLDT